MNIRKLSIILTLLLSLLLTGGLIILAQRTPPPIDLLRPLVPGNPVPLPAPNTHTAPTTTTVSITYSEPIGAATVSTRTFAVHAMQTGQLTQTYDVVSGTISLTPTQPFKPGELVQVSATTGTLNLSGEGPISPTVWQFWTGVEGGAGVFNDSSQRLGDSVSWGIALGDLDGDSDLDAFVANDGQPNTVWMNDGTGIFTISQVLDDLYSYDVALGDLDGDGDLDAFVTNGAAGSSANTVWMNDGTGAFTVTQELGDLFSGGVALGDLDGDGDLDAFVTNMDSDLSGENEVWLNDGQGVFTRTQSLGSLDIQKTLALGDLDKDGDLDAFTAGWTNHVWLNDGTGVFSDTGQSPGLESGGDVVALGDLDGDGDLDVLLVKVAPLLPPTHSLGVWMNDGTGHFSHSGQQLNDSEYTGGVAVGDLDGDGDLDVFATYRVPYWDLLPGHWVEVWLNEGGAQGGTPGHFSSNGRRLDDSVGFDTALGDVDGDGDLDAFVAYGSTNKVWLNQLAPVLTIRKIAPATMVPGSLITYTLTISNTGTATATNPLILDRIPAGAHYVSGGSLNLPFVSWEVGELAPYSGIVSVHFVVTATETIINSDYRVSATGGYTATGSVPVVTVALQHSTYLPVVLRNF